MKLAIPVDEAGQLAENFSRAHLFALYEIKDDTGAVGYLGRETIAAPSCGTTPGVLKGLGVEVVLCHHVSENAVKQLLSLGMPAVKNAPRLSSDALMAHLVSGTLQATAPEGAGTCGGHGGCGHCGDHSHDHEAHEPAEPEACHHQHHGCCHGTQQNP